MYSGHTSPSCLQLRFYFTPVTPSGNKYKPLIKLKKILIQKLHPLHDLGPSL